MSTPTPPPKRKGRPSKGVDRFKPVHVYLPPELLARLDRLVDRDVQRTGHHVTRVDLMRQAIVEYLARRETPQRRPSVVGHDPAGEG
jgi:metal-responsive CopG/Arc/MetJ family transcriptional regulator